MNDFGSLHHVELQVADFPSVDVSWAWLFAELGYEPYQSWVGGRSWRRGATYIVIAEAPREGSHDRRSPGLSHLAFHAGTRVQVDELWASAPEHGWRHLYPDRHPWAGGDEHYAAFVENADRFKVELVASSSVQ